MKRNFPCNYSARITTPLSPSCRQRGNMSIDFILRVRHGRNEASLPLL